MVSGSRALSVPGQARPAACGNTKQVENEYEEEKHTLGKRMKMKYDVEAIRGNIFSGKIKEMWQNKSNLRLNIIRN